MALQRAEKNRQTTPFKFEKKGDTLKGYYKGVADVVINGRPAKEHVYKTSAGSRSVLGQANILQQYKNNNVDVNTYVELTFTGDVKRLPNGNTMKLYDVAFDRDNIDADSHDSSASYDDDGVDDESDDSDDTAEYLPPVPPKTPAAPPSAERQARVREQLKNLRSSQS